VTHSRRGSEADGSESRRRPPVTRSHRLSSFCLLTGMAWDGMRGKREGCGWPGARRATGVAFRSLPHRDVLQIIMRRGSQQRLAFSRDERIRTRCRVAHCEEYYVNKRLAASDRVARAAVRPEQFPTATDVSLKHSSFFV
jgi:hypothetical protein